MNFIYQTDVIHYSNILFYFQIDSNNTIELIDYFISEGWKFCIFVLLDKIMIVTIDYKEAY